MTTSITADNGNTYHLWQLSEYCTPEPGDDWAFTTLDNDLSDGYRSSLLFGSNTGLRSWKLQLPTSPHRSVMANTVTDPNGATVSREEYVRSIYAENRITGTPFAYRDLTTGQFYLCDFKNKSLSRARIKNVKIYDVGLDLGQVRLEGVTVFDVGQLDDQYTTNYWLEGPNFNSGGGTWPSGTDRLGEGTHGATMAVTGDVILGAALQNDLDIVRFSTTSSTGFVADASSGLKLYEAFIVMKMREATFSNVAGIITGTTGGGSQILLGDIGTSKFTSPGAGTEFTYRLNDVSYETSNMQAPMNAWGIVHVRSTTGWTASGGWQLGKNRTTAGSFAKMDVGEFIAFGHLLPSILRREITEYLNVKWGIAV